MKTKPDLSFWKLWNLSFGFFGVQIAYALQSANVSRIFTTIGADPHDLLLFSHSELTRGAQLVGCYPFVGLRTLSQGWPKTIGKYRYLHDDS